MTSKIIASDTIDAIDSEYSSNIDYTIIIYLILFFLITLKVIKKVKKLF
jgi:hypothetical protein